MNENEMQQDAVTEDSAQTSGSIEGNSVCEEPAQVDALPQTEEHTIEFSEKEVGELTSHPMFAHFARGRQEGFQEILVSFREMLGASAEMDTRETVSAKMTPAAMHTVSDVALTERQRAIARAAGMSFREYYNILNG